MIDSFFHKVESIVGKVENPGNQHFLLYQRCFQIASFPGSSNSGLCSKELTLYHNPSL